MEDYIFLREERETCLNYNEEIRMWVISTYVRKHIRKFEEKKYKKIKQILNSDGEIVYAEYEVPEKAVSFRGLEKRKITEEQRHQMSERLQKARENKK